MAAVNVPVKGITGINTIFTYDNDETTKISEKIDKMRD